MYYKCDTYWQEQISDDLMWLPDPNGCYSIEHGTCDYNSPPSEAVGYGHYPYHSYYMSQLPDLDTGYNHGSDMEFSYKVWKYACIFYLKYIALYTSM